MCCPRRCGVVHDAIDRLTRTSASPRDQTASVYADPTNTVTAAASNDTNHIGTMRTSAQIRLCSDVGIIAFK